MERDEDACRLIEQNREKFWPIQYAGCLRHSARVLQDLPAPDSVFLGGSGGMVEEILQLALQKNPYVRVVINAITLETVCRGDTGPKHTRFCGCHDFADSGFPSKARRKGSYDVGAKPSLHSQRTGGGDMTVSLPRVLLAAPSSGAGKTTVTCAILRALHRRGRKLSAFKCGPDYIDPMFHREVLGVPSYNLGPFFRWGQRTVRRLLMEDAQGGRIWPVMEGVMGYYDGIGRYGTGRKLRFGLCNSLAGCLGVGRAWSSTIVAGPDQGISYISLRQPDSRSSLESFISQPVSRAS